MKWMGANESYELNTRGTHIHIYIYITHAAQRVHDIFR